MITRTDHLRLLPYLYVVVLVAALTFIIHVIGLSIERVNAAVLYLIPVLLTATRWGRGPAFFAATLGVVAFDFFFVPPMLSFTVSDLRYLVSFAVFLFVAIITTTLTSKLKLQIYKMRQNEEYTNALYLLSRKMAAASSLADVVAVMHSIKPAVIYGNLALYVPNGDHVLQRVVLGDDDLWSSFEGEEQIVIWVYDHQKKAGRGSSRLGQSSRGYFPLCTEQVVCGVLAYDLFNNDELSEEQLQRLDTISGVCALAVARVQLAEQAKSVHLAKESERLRNILLDSISHELKTPLATVIGSITAVIDGDHVLADEDKKELLLMIREGGMRMNRLITNLLNMVRWETGMVQLQRRWCYIDEVIGAALEQLKDTLATRSVLVNIPENMPFVFVDDVLLEQVIVNIVSNAAKYSHEGESIEIIVMLRGQGLQLAISDQGFGIPKEEQSHVFEKFYRTQNANHHPGTGLGLTICKNIVEAHNGWIKACDNERALHGTTIVLWIATTFQQDVGFEGDALLCQQTEPVSSLLTMNRPFRN